MIWNRPPAFFLFSYSIIQFILYKLLCLDLLSLPPFVFSRSEMTWYLHDIYLTISYSQLLFPFFLFFISRSPVPDSFSSEVKRAFEGEKDDWESERVKRWSWCFLCDFAGFKVQSSPQCSVRALEDFGHICGYRHVVHTVCTWKQSESQKNLLSHIISRCVRSRLRSQREDSRKVPPGEGRWVQNKNNKIP